MNSQNLKKTIIKYLNKQATAGQMDQLEQLLSNELSHKIFKDYVKINFLSDLAMKKFDSEKSKIELLKFIRKEEKVNSIRKRLFHYVSAALILSCIAGGAYLFLEKSGDKKTIQVSKSEFETKIEHGTDKAVLTLEDGSEIALERGSNFQYKNANSNGENLVYEKKNQKDSEEIQYNFLTVPRGGQFFVTLADSTRVWVNSDSKLKYPVSFSADKERQVELVYGEAYFAVSSAAYNGGAGFSVIHQGQIIQVLGTEFNVKAYQEESMVFTTLVEGRVRLNYSEKKFNLIPSQQSQFNKQTNSIGIKKVDVYNEISWKDGVFSFEDKSLKEIMQVLSRWYNVDVKILDSTIKEEKFVGVLGKNQNLEDILSTIQTFGIINEFKIENNEVIIE